MSDNKTIKVSNTADLRMAIEAGYTKDQIEIAQPDNSEAIAAARAEGVTAGKSEASAETAAAVTNAAKTERDRLTALNGIAQQGFEAELKAAIETGQSPADFALAQLKAAQDRGITIGAIKKDSHAASHAAPGSGGQGGKWDSVVAKHGGGKKAA